MRFWTILRAFERNFETIKTPFASSSHILDPDNADMPTNDANVQPTTEDDLAIPTDASGSGEGDRSPKNNDTTEYYTPEEQLIVDYLFEDLLLSFLALENQTTLHKMGHKYEDFVYDCNFRGIDCR